jgi:hypothetical protein
MSDELLTLSELAELYRCSRRHARDVITKMVGFPEIAPGSTPRNPLWIRAEIRAFIHRKATKARQNPEFAHATQ